MAQNIQERETVILLLCVGRAELERLVPTQSPGGSISHRQPWRIVFDKSFFSSTLTEPMRPGSRAAMAATPFG